MKKVIFGFIATFIFSSLSIGQNKMTISSSITIEEYNSLDQNDQRLSDYLSGAIASLNAMELNGAKYQNYDAVIHISNDNKDTLKNGIVVSLIETNNVTEKKGSCQVCGMSSAISCIKKIKKAFEGQDDYDIHVHNDGNGCVTLSW